MNFHLQFNVKTSFSRQQLHSLTHSIPVTLSLFVYVLLYFYHDSGVLKKGVAFVRCLGIITTVIVYLPLRPLRTLEI